jgi:hypothetical protein
MNKWFVLAGLFGLGGCAVDRLPQIVSPGMPAGEVTARLGKPVAEGRLAGDERYSDYSLQPLGYANYRVTFGPDERVRDVRNLLTRDNIAKLQPGMTPDEVGGIVGVSRERDGVYANGTRSWTYRYNDEGVIKLLHVIFDRSERVQWLYSEWDPRVYSKKGGGGQGGGR